MFKKIMPAFALLLGLGGGGTAAIVLAPAEVDTPTSDAQVSEPDEPADSINDDGSDNLEIVKLPSQFVVPVITENRVKAMVILTVALEVEAGQGDRVRTLEPKLRDEFLAELFSLASIGGFEDELISRQSLELVKRALSARSNEVLGTKGVTVLIIDMARQDTF
ncbi:flagellar basal body-associated FliL family protein [Marivita sp.]|jgi:hypothetical protein|uniref:flagellar basal body-associated FliL family protein n=1 Tax=Marivita sp. TaxID=2003365 RepID=UPI00321AA861